MEFWIRETLRWNGDGDAVPFTAHNYPGPNQTVADRRAAIIAFRAAGKSMQAIADIYGLSRQRIEQILKRTDAPKFNANVVDRVLWTCPVCGGVWKLRPGQLKTRQKVGECSPCVSLRSARRGKAIVERRLAGETWMDIQHSIAQDFHNTSNHTGIARDARAYLKLNDASAEVWEIVFPGRGRPRTARARQRISIGQTLRYALTPRRADFGATRESPSGDTQSSSPSSDRTAGQASQSSPAVAPSPATTR